MNAFGGPILDQNQLRSGLVDKRIAMGRFSNNHEFPPEGDGILKFKGNAPVPAWFDWRWKAAIED